MVRNYTHLYAVIVAEKGKMTYVPVGIGATNLYQFMWSYGPEKTRVRINPCYRVGQGCPTGGPRGEL